MKTIANEKDLEGINKFDEVNYICFDSGVERGLEDNGIFLDSFKQNGNTYVALSTVQPLRYSKRDFIESQWYLFEDGKMIECYIKMTGGSEEGQLEQNLNEHLKWLSQEKTKMEKKNELTN